MAKIGNLTLTGKSKQKYDFDVYPINTNFKSIGAVYYISKRTKKSDGTRNHEKIYIGQTGDISERFDNHHKENCFNLHGANCISICQNNNENDRFNMETDLIQQYNPPCNG